MELLKNFNGLTMQVFKKGKEVFSGRYSKQSDFEYVPIYTTKTKSVRVSEEPLIKESVCTCRCFYKCYKRMYQVFSGIFVLYLFIWMILSFCELHEIIWPATVLFMVLFSIFTFCTFGFIFLHYVRDECALFWLKYQVGTDIKCLFSTKSALIIIRSMKVYGLLLYSSHLSQGSSKKTHRTDKEQW